MFERFTDRARHVVVLAQEESRRLNHTYIGTEHILLGLVAEGDGIGAKALLSLGVSLEAVRSQVEEIIGRGGTTVSGHIPFTPRAKKVLELSLREALQLGHNYIGTEHILLGLIREGEGVAAQVLGQLGMDLSRVRQQVIQLLSGYSGPGIPDPAGATGRAPIDPLEQLPTRNVFIELLRYGEEMRVVTLEALRACWDGDTERLEEMLGQAVRLASLANDRAQLAMLSHLVIIDDADEGVVRLKPRPA
jgi:ATP-dependent Clp protease ATP-binding subunit ClpA